MARALELTDEQKAAFREVLEQDRTKMQSPREKMRENRQVLAAALEGDDPPGGSAGIAGAVLFSVVSVVLIAMAPHPHDTPHVRPGAAPSFESVPPVAAPEPACDACDPICERCRELCGRDGTMTGYSNGHRFGETERRGRRAYEARSATSGPSP